MRVAILASGNGSNFEALAHQFQAGLLPGELAFVFSDHHDAYVLERAQRLNVRAFSFEVKEFENKTEYEKSDLSMVGIAADGMGDAGLRRRRDLCRAEAA